MPQSYSSTKEGNLILRIEDDDLTIPDILISASEHPPKLYLTSSYSPSVFFLLPLKSSGYFFPTVQKNLKLELKTDLQTNRDYPFFLASGNYYMNITNHSDAGLDFPVFLDRNIPKQMNLSFGFRVKTETEYQYSVENYSGDCIQWNSSDESLHFLDSSSGVWCDRIKIFPEKITVLKIRKQKTVPDIIRSVSFWLPGMIFLVPLYYGHSVYEKQYSAEIQYTD